MTTNYDLFERANAQNDIALKEKLRNDFLAWCKKNNKPILSPMSTQEWWAIDMHSVREDFEDLKNRCDAKEAFK
jgi:uncharacterized protein YcsI (UPF0317 family)